MKSMTGYGQVEKTLSNGATLKIELKSYNRKQLDIKLNIPHSLNEYEIKLRQLLTRSISRGSINGRIELTYSNDSANKEVLANINLAKDYIKAVNELQKATGVNGELRINDLIKYSQIITTSEKDNDESFGEELEKAFLEAINNFISSRENEGKLLQKDLLEKASILESELEKIIPLTKDIPQIQKEKLFQKINDLGIDIDINDDRLLKELIIYADKHDVSEEETRLRSHFKQLRKHLTNSSNKPVGRNLDFLLQEIQREINTMGVKSAGVDTSKIIVTLKTETEKIREQIQNIE